MSDVTSISSGIGNGRKYWAVALGLSVFLGVFGIDRFYLGKIDTGVVKLICWGLSWVIIGIPFMIVWWIVDICIIASGNMRDSNGLPLVTMDHQ